MVEHPSGTRGIAYVRKSTDAQDTERQHVSIKNWSDKHRVQPKTLEDTGKRHKAASRAQFQHMMKLVESRQIDWIVLDAIDRLGFADPLEWGHYAYIARSNDVEIWSATEDKCLTRIDAGTVLTSNISAIGSRDEMTKKALRDLGKKRAMTRTGDFVGGWCPYGLDVVALGSDGQERWRVVTVGKWQREKRYSNGTSERYDGKGNFPPRSQEERLVLRPTVIADRITALRVACERIAEGHSINSTAKELNNLGYRHPHGRWYAILLSEVIKNPAILGRPSYNKTSNAQYATLEDRQPTALGETKGKHIRRARADWEIPEEQFPPLVDPELVSRAIERMADRSPGKRAPRSLKLWLSGLLICKRCGKPMAGWAYAADKRTPYSYACPTYRRDGIDNDSGCRLHRVGHPKMEAIIDEYLAGLDATITEVKQAGEGGLLGLVFDRKREAYNRLANLREGMEDYLLATLGQVAESSQLSDGRTRFTLDQPDGPPITLDLPGCDNAVILQDTYSWIRSATAAKSKARIQEIDARLTALSVAWTELPTPRTKQICAEEMTKLEAERNALEAGAMDLGSEVRQLFRELVALGSKIRTAKLTADTEQKSKLVRSIIERVELEFTHVQAGTQLRSRLCRATVIPLLDVPERTFAMEGAREPD